MSQNLFINLSIIYIVVSGVVFYRCRHLVKDAVKSDLKVLKNKVVGKFK